MTTAATARLPEKRAPEVEGAAQAMRTPNSDEAPQPTPRADFRPGRAFVRMPSRVQPKLEVGAPGDRYEREADDVADHVRAGKPANEVSLISASGLKAQRVPADEEQAEEQDSEHAAQRKCAECASDEAAQRIPDSAQTKCDDAEVQRQPDNSAPDPKQDSPAGDSGADSDSESDSGPEAPSDEAADETPDNSPEKPEELQDPADPDCGDEPETPSNTKDDADGNTDPAGRSPAAKSDDLGCGDSGGADETPDEGGVGGTVKSCATTGAPPAPTAGVEQDPAPASANESSPTPATPRMPPCSDPITSDTPKSANTESPEANTEPPSPAATGECANAQRAPEDSSAGAATGHSPEAESDAEDSGIAGQAQAACAACSEHERAQAVQRDEEGDPPVDSADTDSTDQEAQDEDEDDTPGRTAPSSSPQRPGARELPPGISRGAVPAERGSGRSQLDTNRASANIAARGPGEPLPDTVRSRIESSVGVDLSAVRTHSDGNAQEASKALRAKAFTHKSHIFLGAGQSPHDVGLIAHESTHVLQQNAIERKPAASARAVESQPPGPRPAGEKGDAARAGGLTPPGSASAPAGVPGAVSASISGAGSASGAGLASAAPTSTSAVGRTASAAGVRTTAPSAAGPASAPATAALTSTATAGPASTLAAPTAASAPTATRASGAAPASARVSTTTAPTTARGTSTATSGAAPATPSGTVKPITASTDAVASIAGASAATGPDVTGVSGGDAGSQKKPTPPSPETDERFQGVITRLAAATHHEKSHGHTRDKVAEAKAAVRPQDNEPESRADNAQMGAMEASTEAGPKPQPETFRELLQKKLDQIKPSNMEEAVDFKSSGKANQLRGEVTGELKAQKDQATRPLVDAMKTRPGLDAFRPKELPKALAPDTPEAALGTLHAEEVLPEPKSDAAISVQHNRDEADRLMAENDLDEDQLRRANEPQFTQALEAKHELEAHTDQVPKEYRTAEQPVLATAVKDTTKASAHGLLAMRGKRTYSKGTVRGAQDTAQAAEERARNQVASDIQKKFAATQSKVENRLARLDTTVGDMFDRAEAIARAVFEDYVDQQMSNYKDDRYGSFGGGVKWLKDKIAGMPDDVDQFYVDGTARYMRSLSRAFDDIADKVEAELACAKGDIALGKDEVCGYIKGLDGDQQRFAKDAFTAISGSFEALEASVDDKRESLATDLSQRYRDSRAKLDERIEELKAENEGLLDKFVAFIKRVIEVLKKLKDLAVLLLKVGGSVLRGLLKDPIGFLGNLLGAIKLGFSNFSDRIGTHLKDALITYVTGTVREIGISAAADSTPKGIFGLVLQILGLTVDRIRAKVVKLVGARNVERVQKVWDVVTGMLRDGAAGLWAKAKGFLSGLKERVEEELGSWIGTQILKAGLTWLASLFSPVSALIRAIKMIYDVASFFVNNIDRIIDLVNGVLEAIAAVVAGNVPGAAKRVEDSLERGLVVLLGFLASALGLSGIADKVRSIISRVRDLVERALDAVLALVARGVKWIAKKGAAVFRGVISAGKSVARRGKAAVGHAAKAVRHFFFPRRSFAAGGERHQLFFRGTGPQAQLMIASDTKAIASFVAQLRARPENKGGDGKAALEAVDAQIELIAAAKKRIAQQPEQSEQQIAAALEVIADRLRFVLFRGPVASEEQPLPIDYPKRASVAYPRIYAGPNVTAGGPRISQLDLRDARFNPDRKQAMADALPDKAGDAWEKAGMQIREYFPHGDDALPDGGVTLGIRDPWRIALGRKLRLPNKHQTTPGGGRINSALAPYGFSPKREGLDGDHVTEIQLGGKDRIENLWPLDKSENRGAGSLVKSAQLDLPDGGKIAMSELKERAQRGAAVWLVIRSTKGG